MNFLAHLHLASLADSSLLGNLMADFVRGNPDGLYSAEVVAGIRMHRRIDTITDSHPVVKSAKTLFSADCRRVAPIALDVVWDHFLARHWSRVEPDVPLRRFVLRAEALITPALPQTPEAFRSLNNYLWRERWLERYAQRPFLAQVLTGMASRRPRLAALGEIYPEIEQHYPALEGFFWQLYPDMMQLAKLGADSL
ncbi:ACP phosphodiesterase [Sodalis sp. dw_96]|uniref:acyl carrier protein phosphodiesterase n=1 Tax=Sodalis sp. dw_96 TaxID=2719794 RepID=UPI001BD400C2|nr:ACP phosphodiesterase [Sodalis sp. dw_96]